VRENTKVFCEPIIASREAKQVLCKPNTVSTETNLASRQRINVAHEAIKVPCEPKIASSKVIWVARSIVSSLDSVSCEAKIVYDHKTISALRRAKLRLSREAKAKASFVNREATVAPFTSSALLGSARLIASGRTKALSAQIASLCEGKVQPRLL